MTPTSPSTTVSDASPCGTPITAPSRKREPARAYAVVLHNDGLNAIDYAACTLSEVLGLTPREAWRLARLAHTRGHAVLWVGLRRGADDRAHQLIAAGPDPIMSAFGAQPLNAQVLPMG